MQGEEHYYIHIHYVPKSQFLNHQIFNFHSITFEPSHTRNEEISEKYSKKLPLVENTIATLFHISFLILLLNRFKFSSLKDQSSSLKCLYASLFHRIALIACLINSARLWGPCHSNLLHVHQKTYYLLNLVTQFGLSLPWFLEIWLEIRSELLLYKSVTRTPNRTTCLHVLIKDCKFSNNIWKLKLKTNTKPEIKLSHTS